MSVGVLTPIETKYKGILFRSRIEARWALFFDKIGVPWEYEKEGYNLDGICYLPDFWLPAQDCFFEVKGAKPTDEEREKAARLAAASGKNVYLFSGGLPIASFYVMHELTDLYDSDQYFLCFYPDGYLDGLQLWSKDPCSFGEKYIICGVDDTIGECSATDKLVYAYNAARSARFGI